MSDARLAVVLTWQRATPALIVGRIVVVIDVLRWSTVVLTALENGAERVEAFATPETARVRAAELGHERVLLGGERASAPIAGFDVGNSPHEYAAERVRDRVVVTTTTNGTQALLAAHGASEVLIGGFVNVDAVAARLGAALGRGEDVTLLCAGQVGDETVEDTACAGALADALIQANQLAAPDCDEPTARARSLWLELGRSTPQVMGASPHAAALRAAGYAPDVISASQFSIRGIVGRQAQDGAILAS